MTSCSQTGMRMNTIHNLTIETRLDSHESGELTAYFEQWRTEYGKIFRYAWYRYARPPKRPSKSAFNTELQRRFGITKRTANSIIYEVSGRYSALLELKKTEIKQLEEKAAALEEQIQVLKKEVYADAALAAENRLSPKELAEYKNRKRSLYYKKQKLKKKKDRIRQFVKDIQEGNLKICFGGRKLFDAQNRLAENGFRSHRQWYQAFTIKRDANILYLGSKDESACNQMFQLRPLPDGSLSVQCRKDGKAVKEKTDRYVYGRCRFSYLGDQLCAGLLGRQNGITYRIHFEGKKIYLQAILTITVPEVLSTNMTDGAIGLDFNNGFIQLAETDREGNLVDLERFPLLFHGTGGRAENEIRQVVSRISRRSLQTGKSIVIEDLDFKHRKSRCLKGKGKKGRRYNRIIHLLDYSRYKVSMKNSAVRNQIDLIVVNPAYTSAIAREKYCEQRKLNVHAGAAYVIARRGQGFKEKTTA